MTPTLRSTGISDPIDAPSAMTPCRDRIWEFRAVPTGFAVLI